MNEYGLAMRAVICSTLSNINNSGHYGGRFRFLTTEVIYEKLTGITQALGIIRLTSIPANRILSILSMRRKDVSEASILIEFITEVHCYYV